MNDKGIVNIAIEKIYQHPDNPRKDLGDLSELSESIKKKGVMQNLRSEERRVGKECM